MPIDQTNPDDSPQPSVVPTKQLDFNNLRLGQGFQSSAGIKKPLVTVPVQKPPRQEYFRVNPDPSFQFPANVLEVKSDDETFLVDRSLWEELGHELSPRLLLAAITRQGLLFIWPLRLEDAYGRLDPWSASASVGAESAKSNWTRVTSNRGLGRYDVFDAPTKFPDAEWPEATMEQILEIAFRGRIITTVDHPAVRRLRGLE